MRVPHLGLLSPMVAALLACSGGGGSGGGDPACVAGAACTPSAACSKGELRCDPGGPTCVATTPLPDGTTCGDGATCAGGTCQRTITVSAVDRYHDDAGNVVTVPRASLGESTFRALVLGPDGTYQAFPGSAVAPGVVQIPGVPVGTCLVERTDPWSTAPSFTELSGNVLDDSSDLARRPDVAYSTLPTRIELDATGLAPWQVPAYPEDRLQIVLPSFAPSLDLWDPGILDGATEGTVVPWPGTTIRTPLLDGAAGDRVHVVQLGRVDGPVAYLTPVRAGVLPETFSVEDGVDQVAQVALGPIARTGTLEVDWAIGEMEALLGEMGPGMYPGQFPSHELTVDALQQGLGPASATLLEVWTGAAADTLHLGPLAYGRPYPDSFEETAWISMTAAMEVTLAVWETNRQTDVTVAASLGPPTPGRMVARPSLSPPHAVRLAGRDVSRTPQLDVGTTPTISWSPPSLGTAALYRVTLYRVITNGPTRTAARFLTTSTQLQIPPGILQADAFHYARLTAFGDGGYAETVTAGFLP